MWYFCMKLVVKYTEYWVSTVYTDGLVLKHQGITDHNAEYVPMT